MMLRLFLKYTLCFLVGINVTQSKISDEEYTLMPTLFDYENYDHCILLYGQDALYCTISIQLYPTNLKNPSKTWTTIAKVSSKPEHYRHDLLRHGLCINRIWPNLTIEELKNNKKLFSKIEKQYGEQHEKRGIKGRLQKISCQGPNTNYRITTIDLVFGILFVMFPTLVLLAWLCDMLLHGERKNVHRETTLEMLINSFSLSRNWKRLNNTDLSTHEMRALRCIQGIRCYTMMIVIFGHTIIVNMSLPTSNPKYAESLNDSSYVIWIGNGTRDTTVQINFMISAWLLTYKYFTQQDRKKVSSATHLFCLLIDRYLRLTPAMGVTIAFFATWMVHLAHGPSWDVMIEAEYSKCRSNWWSNLLYISNYVHGEKMCSPHLWYLSVDMQLYIIGLSVLYILWRNQDKIVIILGGLWTFQFCVLAVIIYWQNFESYVSLYPEAIYNMNIINLDGSEALYKSVISNMGSFIIGILYGYIFYNLRKRRLVLNKFHLILWWIFSWGTVAIIVLIPGLKYYLNQSPNILYNVLYGSLHKSIFIFGFGLWVLGVTQGEGHITKFVCEWPPTYVFGRLTYSAFLIHPLFQRAKGGLQRLPYYVDDQVMFFESVQDVTVAYLGATFLTLLVEMPVRELIKCTKRKKFKMEGSL